MIIRALTAPRLKRREKKADATARKQTRVVLAGNPNAGKTTLFNALTKSNLKTGNWHGVTTSPASKTCGGVTYVDVPGMYAFDAYSMEEKSAAEEVKNAQIIVNVVDSLTLENSLRLTRRLVALNPNVLVYLTKTKRLRSRGGSVDPRALQDYLGVPVFDCPPATLRERIENGDIDFRVDRKDIAFDRAYSAGNFHLNRAEKLFYHRVFAPVFFVAAMVFTFFLTFHPSMAGAVLKSLTERLITGVFSDFLASHISNEILRSFVCDGLIGGAGGVLSFVPQITLLYLLLILLDESGVMSALSFVTDGVFEKVHLSGRAAFSLISGFGCTAAAIATTRGYSDESAQRRTVAILPLVPCGAKLPVFLTLLSPVFRNPFPAICILYFAGLALAVALSALVKGKEEGLIGEITPVSPPSFSAVKNKLFFYVKGFIIKVTTGVTLFCALSWLLSNFNFALEYVPLEESALCMLSKLVCPVFAPMGVTDWRLAYALVTGFAAKENVAATVSLLMPEGTGLSLASTFGVCAFLLACPACISAFVASVKEIGWKDTLKFNFLQLAGAFAFGYAVNLLLSIL